VEDKQLSLAIGKKGQNVRLAAKLTGWRIDIKSEEEKRKEVEAQFEVLETAPGEGTEGDDAAAAPADASSDESGAAPDEGAPLPYTIEGVTDRTVRKLVEAGYETREAVAALTEEQLSEIPGIGEKTAEKILQGVRS